MNEKKNATLYRLVEVLEFFNKKKSESLRDGKVRMNYPINMITYL